MNQAIEKHNCIVELWSSRSSFCGDTLFQEHKIKADCASWHPLPSFRHQVRNAISQIHVHLLESSSCRVSSHFSPSLSFNPYVVSILLDSKISQSYEQQHRTSLCWASNAGWRGIFLPTPTHRTLRFFERVFVLSILSTKT